MWKRLAATTSSLSKSPVRIGPTSRCMLTMTPATPIAEAARVITAVHTRSIRPWCGMRLSGRRICTWCECNYRISENADISTVCWQSARGIYSKMQNRYLLCLLLCGFQFAQLIVHYQGLCRPMGAAVRAVEKAAKDCFFIKRGRK